MKIDFKSAAKFSPKSIKKLARSIQFLRQNIKSQCNCCSSADTDACSMDDHFVALKNDTCGKKRVSFEVEVKLNLIPAVEDDEKTLLWWSHEEMESMEKEAITEIENRCGFMFEDSDNIDSDLQDLFKVQAERSYIKNLLVY
mmetsp:Transcript_6476/g.9739  ORF Transcript_6476/g.9739 Transcript_6476/m.9739 type:complete len:142 (-) Transcript_6476:52-477(-)